MDYLKIVLKGISDKNSNSYLIEYFKREFKNAKKKNYEPIEFFNGLKRIIRSFENDLQSQLYKRKSELEFMLHQAKNKTVKFNEKDQPDLTYEEKCDFLLKNCESELKDLSKNSFYFTINKIIENKSITGQLSYADIKRIDKSIFIAEKEIQLKKFQKQVSKIKPKEDDSENKYPRIFKNKRSLNIFESLHEKYEEKPNPTANYSFIFYAMEKDKFVICGGSEFIKFLSQEFRVEIDRIDSRQSGSNNRTLLYNQTKNFYK